jgi:N-acetylglutamate synthase-like GNAT family acetyltransferase
MAITIRRAVPEEADALTELALRSKASWGYDDAFMAACRDALTITGDEIHHYPVFVVADDQRVVGYYAMALDPPECFLVALFIDPEALKLGHGFRMFAHATATARAIGCKRMRIESDPNAEGFFAHMGARKTGETESEAQAGRVVPVMQYDMG